MKRHLSTLEDITEPISCTCTRCGGNATIYPYPQPTGTCVCECSTPAWYKSFIHDMSAKLRSGELPLEAF